MKIERMPNINRNNDVIILVLVVVIVIIIKLLRSLGGLLNVQ